MKIIIFLLIKIFFSNFIPILRQFKFNTINNNNSLIRNLLTNNEIQKLNNIITIYNPSDIVTSISTATNENGDILIVTNTEDSNSSFRIIYGIKSDGTNFFSDNEDSYILINTNNNSNTINFYPMISTLKINGKEYIINFTQRGNIELYDYNNKLFFDIYKFHVIKEISLIYKNTFTHLKYYNYSNYILTAYVYEKILINILLYKKFILKNLISHEINQKTKKKLKSVFQVILHLYLVMKLMIMGNVYM